jgi:hypothetical protein
MSLGTRRRAAGRAQVESTYGALGLVPDAGLTDDEVRVAWRRLAAATHRADGGDPAAFAAAAAAYTVLRTRTGRGELTADAGDAALRVTRPARRPRTGRWALRWTPGPLAGLTGLAGLAWRAGRGRPWRLAARVAGAGGVSAAALAVAGSRPAGPALVTGAVTWLVLTARRDLAAPPAPPDGGRGNQPAG